MNGPWIGLLSAADLAGLFVQFLLMSLMAVGGASAVLSEMHRYVSLEHGWLTDAQFTASVAVAQAAPGPNVLIAAVVGYNVGGLAGALAALLGMLLPSTTLALAAMRWADANRHTRVVKALLDGLAPMTIGLVLAGGWVLAEPARAEAAHGRWGTVVLIAAAVVAMLRTRLNPVVLIAAGALAGGLGLA
jgi:chromate transporter